jgi:carbonic anhydrase
MHRFLILLVSCVPPAAAPAWHYGEAWGGLCAGGKRQSPIAVSGGPGFAPKVQLEYWPSRTRLFNNGHTVQLDYDAGSFLTVDGRRYALQQLHFHHSAEHTVDDKTFPLELHLVHKSDDNKLAVVAVMIAEGAENPWMRPLLDDLPRPGERREPTARLNAADLVPRSRVFLHYSGSLTTPPCSEEVSWFVMRTATEMSAAQIAELSQLLGDNHRPLQPSGGRQIIEGEVR